MNHNGRNQTASVQTFRLRGIVFSNPCRGGQPGNLVCEPDDDGLEEEACEGDSQEEFAKE